MAENRHQLPGWAAAGWGADRLGDEGLVLHPRARAKGREACDLTGWAKGQ